jgi:hypothetical protein
MNGITTFKITSWDETPYSEVEGGGKLTKAAITKTYTGVIEGEGKLEYVMAHNPDGSATFYGFERVTGSIGNKRGSFVFQRSGTYENGQMQEEVTVVPGSGTQDLQSLSGKGNITAGHQQEYPMSFEYEFL